MDDIELRSELEKIHAVSFGWAMSCCSHDRHEAGDVLQTAYLKVLDGRARYNGRSSFKTWLFSVIRNTAAEERRRHWYRSLGLAKFADSRAAEDNTSEDRYEDQDEKTREFRKSLGKLPRRQQEVLHLVFYQDMTLEEASVAMGVSIGSARTHYERAKKGMRSLLYDKEGKT